MAKIQDFPEAVKYVHSRLRDQEDLAQDALLLAWERRAEWDAIRDLGRWIVTLGVNMARNEARRRQVETRALRRIKSEASFSVPAAQEDALFTRELASRREMWPAVAAAVGATSARGDAVVSRSRAAARQLAMAA